MVAKQLASLEGGARSWTRIRAAPMRNPRGRKSRDGSARQRPRRGLPQIITDGSTDFLRGSRRLGLMRYSRRRRSSILLADEAPPSGIGQSPSKLPRMREAKDNRRILSRPPLKTRFRRRLRPRMMRPKTPTLRTTLSVHRLLPHQPAARPGRNSQHLLRMRSANVTRRASRSFAARSLSTRPRVSRMSWVAKGCCRRSSV